jgi:hypothetical protein
LSDHLGSQYNTAVLLFPEIAMPIPATQVNRFRR